jgi:hypothetical protein
MLSKILDIVNVRPDERKQVLLLLGKGFFLGVFLVTYQISAEALFLNNLSHLLKEALLVSGGLGMLTTALFSFLQSRVSYSKLVVGNILLIFTVTAGIYGLFSGLDGTWQNYIIFGMFALIGPITAVVILGFWGVFGRLFNLRQSKRIVGWIDTGQLTAAILATVSIPLLGAYIPNTVDYLLISAGSVLVAGIFLLMITFSFDLSLAESNSKQQQTTKERSSFRNLFKDNYIVLMSMFLLFSMVTFTFIQYSFQTVASLQYPSENDLRNFLATFHLGYLLLSFVMQTFVNDKIIGVYGLKVALFILPIIVGFFTICAIVAGTVFGFVPTADGSTAFIWFFLFISISRLFNYSIRDALENPTFKLFFMPLESNKRFDAQTKVEGVVNETSRLLAGIVILALSFVSFFELIHYSYAVIFLIGGYLFFVGKLYNQYRNKIKLKLETRDSQADPSETERITMARNLEEALGDSKPEKVIFLFRLLEKINPNAVGSSINKLMRHSSIYIRDYAQAKLNEIKGLSVSDNYVIKFNQNSDDKEGKHLVGGIDLESLLNTGNITKKRIAKLSKSDDSEDRLYAAELLGNSGGLENISFLIELLLDANYAVRLAAIQASEKNYNDEIINALVENLPHPIYSNKAMNVLVKIGGKSLTAIDTAFYRTGQTTKTMLKILQIYGRVGGNKSIKQLWSKIDYPNKVIVSQVLVSLGECGFKAGISQISRIKFAIESDIDDVAWNIAAIGEINQDGHGNILVEAIRDENQSDLQHIYMLLGMLYDARSIQLVKENIESGTAEGIAYAIELLDVFLSDDLKQKVIPLLDDLSEYEKSKKLEIFFPRAPLDGNTVLKFLINRDFNQTNRWVKSCAIYQIGYFKLKSYALDVIANLFNPDELVLQISAWTLYQISPALYEEHTMRIDRQVKSKLDRMIVKDHHANQILMKYDIVQFLRNVTLFSQVEGIVLASLADNFTSINMDQGQRLQLTGDQVENFYIIHSGVVEVEFQNGATTDVISGQFIGEYVQSDNNNISAIVGKSEVVFFELSKDKFYELLSDNIDFAGKVVSYF